MIKRQPAVVPTQKAAETKEERHYEELLKAKADPLARISFCRTVVKPSFFAWELLTDWGPEFKVSPSICCLPRSAHAGEGRPMRALTATSCGQRVLRHAMTTTEFPVAVFQNPIG